MGRLAAANARLQLLPALLAIAAVKALLLFIDANPRFFLWDSVTYLQGAVGGPLPRDRSFLYSLLIEAVAVPTHSLLVLVGTRASFCGTRSRICGGRSADRCRATAPFCTAC